VFRSARNHDELAGLDDNDPITKLHAESALQDEEELVLSVMGVPDELPLELGQLDVEVVDLRHDSRAPVLGEE
jgi:hypothetical protein